MFNCDWEWMLASEAAESQGQRVVERTSLRRLYEWHLGEVSCCEAMVHHDKPVS